MATLAREAASFKASLHRQDYTSWHSNPALRANANGANGSSSTPATNEAPPLSASSESSSKKKRPKQSQYHSDSLETELMLRCIFVLLCSFHG